MAAAGNRFNPDEERELLVKAQQGDLLARKRLHIIYRGLLDNIVYQKFSHTPQPISAVRAEAEGLLDKCIDSWDNTATNKPSTYIHSYIEHKLLRYVNDNKQMVRTTEKYAWKTEKFNDSVKELRTQFNREPSDSEIADFMNARYPGYNLTIKDIGRLRNEVRTTTLSSMVIGQSDENAPLTVGDITFTTTVDPLKQYSLILKARGLQDRINSLPEPNQTIIKYHAGVDGFPQLSLRDIAVKTGMNKYRVQKVIDDSKELLEWT